MMAKLETVLEQILQQIDEQDRKIESLETTDAGGIWTDYSGDSTIVGWTSYTVKKIMYKKVGNTVFVNVEIDGESDDTVITFSLPFTHVADGANTNTYFKPYDNGAWDDHQGAAILNSGGDTVYAYRHTGAWTATGRKIVRVHFFYEAA